MCRDALDDEERAIPLKRDCSFPGFGFPMFANDTFHGFFLFARVFRSLASDMAGDLTLSGA